MVAPTKVQSYVTDVDDLSQWLVDNPNAFKTYVEGLIGSGAGSNNLVTVVSTPGQTVFSTAGSPSVDTGYMIVFIGAAFQPPTTYSIDTVHQITFNDPVPGGLNVHFLERKLASTTVINGGVTGQVLTKISNTDGDYNWQSPVGGGGGGSTPGTTFGMSHYSNLTVASPTEDFDIFDNMSMARTAAGSYTVTLAGMSVADYIVSVSVDETSINSRTVKIRNKTTAGFDLVVENSVDSANVDPTGLHLLISVAPAYAPTNIIAQPVGMFGWYAAAIPPIGYLECNGSLVSRVTYAALFAVIGTTFNTGGEAVDVFRLPDVRGRFVRGWNHAAADNNEHDEDIGRVFGSYQADDNKAHTHQWLMIGTSGGYDSGSHAIAQNYTGGGWTTSSSGGGEARPRNIAFLPCIKAIPDFNSYAALQMYDSFTVSSASQSLFTTTTVDTRYAYVFVDGSYQPPSEYTVPAADQVQFNVAIPRGSAVDVVKIYAATSPAASKDNMISAASNEVFVTPASVEHSPLAAKGWVKFSISGSGVVTINGSRGVASVTRTVAGRFIITWQKAFTTQGYVPSVTSMGGGVSRVDTQSETTLGIVCTSNTTNDLVDPTSVYVVVFGIQ